MVVPADAPGTDARKLDGVIREIGALSRKLSLPDVVTDEAVRICKNGLERTHVKKKPVVHLSASSLYAACRRSEVPTTLEDVAWASGMRKRDVARWYRLLVNDLDLSVPVMDPSECLSRLASKARVEPKVEADAREVLSRASRMGITGGVNPTGLAAAALYLASLLNGRWMTQSRMADLAGVREVTVRSQYKRLRPLFGPPRVRTTRRKGTARSGLTPGEPAEDRVPVASPRGERATRHSSQACPGTRRRPSSPLPALGAVGSAPVL
jgi:transcription initiation factor TFIIIB Brf1 subunit/transcription initiation factor TFIIB